MSTTFPCKVCNIICTGDVPYLQHVSGEKHKKKIALLKALESNSDIIPQPVANPVASSEKKQLNDNQNLDFNFCSVCNIPCSGFFPYQQHINGKSHQKQVERQIFLKRMQNTSPVQPLKTIENKDIRSHSLNHISDDQILEINKMLLNTQISKVTSIDTSKSENLLVNYNYCDICNITCSGYIPYQDHIRGEKHRKKLASRQLVSYRLALTSASSMSPNAKEMEINLNGKCESPTTIDSGRASRNSEIDDTSCEVNSLTEVSKAISDILSNANKNRFPTSFFCALCQVHCTGPFPYEQHIKGEKHMKRENIFKVSVRPIKEPHNFNEVICCNTVDDSKNGDDDSSSSSPFSFEIRGAAQSVPFSKLVQDLGIINIGPDEKISF